MPHGDSVTQAPSSFGSIIPTGLEPVNGEQQHRGSRLLPHKLPPHHWLGVSLMAAPTCQRGWEILPGSHPARGGDGFWWKAHSSYHRRKFTLPYLPALIAFVTFAM